MPKILSCERARSIKEKIMIGKFDPKSHWEKVYQSKKPEEVSWYQLNPTISVELIAFTGISQEQRIIDVGGGASVLIDKLFENGFRNITVLDISAQAIQHAKERIMFEVVGFVKTSF